MGNIFRLNSLFELELITYPEPIVVNNKIRDKSLSLEYLFLPLSTEKDSVYISELDDYFISYLRNIMDIKGNIIHRNNNIKNLNLIEWGKFHSIKENGEIIPDNNSVKISKILNSKISQNSYLYRENNFYSNIFNEKIEYDSSKYNYPILIKPEIGFSGIGHKIISSEKEFEQFIKSKNIKTGLIQPFLKRIKDYSILFNKENESIIPLCITEMVVSSKNNYLSTNIINSYEITNIESEEFNMSILLENSKAGNLNNYEERIKKLILLNKYNIFKYSFQSIQSFIGKYKLNYNGPIAVDGFFYNENENIYLAISEINFRYSMGRILYELKNKFPQFNDHKIIIESGSNHSGDGLNDIVDSVKKKYEPAFTIILTPPILKKKKISSFVIYVGIKVT